MAMPTPTLHDLNGAEQEAFVAMVGFVFEHSPWIAAEAWRQRPFASLEQLHQSLCTVLREATAEEKLNLIRAHPDLVGKAALAGSLTAASSQEQAAAGLDRLSPEEIAQFTRYNAQYHQQFGFPFVICARENKKESILAAFPVRLQHSRDKEVETALAEIAKIAWLRLVDAVRSD